MIKVAITGITGCGKTSCINEVKKVLSLKSNVEVSSKSEVKNPFDEDKKASFVSQFFYFSNYINEENILTAKNPDYLLCDSSILDQWILWKNYLTSRGANNGLPEKNQLLKHIFEYWIKTYDMMFFVRINLKRTENDDFNRESINLDPEFINRMEDMYTKTIKEYSLQATEIINNGTIDESAHKMIQLITDFSIKSSESD